MLRFAPNFLFFPIGEDLPFADNWAVDCEECGKGDKQGR